MAVVISGQARTGAEPAAESGGGTYTAAEVEKATDGRVTYNVYDVPKDLQKEYTLAFIHLNKADPFTEPVVSKDRTLFRARFAGLDRDQAEAVCRTLKRADISCMTVRN